MHFVMYIPHMWQERAGINWHCEFRKQLCRSWCSTQVTQTVNYCILTLLLLAHRDLEYTWVILQPVVQYVRDQYTTFIFTFPFKLTSFSVFAFILCPTLIEASLPDACYAYLYLHICIQHRFYYCHAKTTNLGRWYRDAVPVTLALRKCFVVLATKL